ncbi:MAG TPA: M28 family peptidase [Flavisolibacter sp.]|nr:M28 family peptidase [Flavisolibacter sp.]
MKKFLIAFLAFGSVQGFAQKAANPSAYARSISADDLKKHLYIVASKEMAGRETGTEGERKAAAYIESQFRRIGLQPGNNGSYQMYFDVFQDSVTGAGLEVNGKAFEMDRDFNVTPTSTAAVMRFSEVVVLGPDAADSVKNLSLAGKAVLLLPGQATGNRPAGGSLSSILSGKGVAAVFTIGNYPRTAPASRKGGQSMSSFKRSVSPQGFSVSEAVAKAIIGADYDQQKSNKSLVKTYGANLLLDVRKTVLTMKSSNVIGVLPGTDLKDEYLFVTAHHDHIGQRDTVINYGADDDGSGTVSVMEIAEAFAKAKAEGKGPRRSIVFMTVSGEEKGLWGSDYYTSNPIFPLDKTTADLNIDMIGRIDPKRTQGDSLNYVYVVGDDKLSSDLRTISEAANKKYTKLELDYKFNDPNDPMRIYFRSDHYNFAKNGVPIIFYFNGTHADYHRPGDTPDKINYPLMAKRAQLVFYTAWEMANRNEMLKRDIPLQVPARPM